MGVYGQESQSWKDKESSPHSLLQFEVILSL